MGKNRTILPSAYVVCIYVRLSMEDDDISGNPVKAESGSITSQRQMIRDYLKRNQEFSQCRIIERCDDGFSGTHFDTRPAFTEMIEMAKKGEVNCIIVKDFSRFGRNYVELGDYLEQLFPFLGVRFISVNDGYDSDDLEGGDTAGLNVAFQNLIYDYYSKELSAKAKLSCRQRAEHGLYSASFALYGYRKDPRDKHKIEIDEEESKIVRDIFDMKLSGVSLSDICRNLNDRKVPCPVERILKNSNKSDWFGLTEGFVWTPSSVFHILGNEQYTGTLVALKSTSIEPGGKRKDIPRDEWVRVEGTHEAIISREEFAAVQKSFNTISHRKSTKRNVFCCGYCGRKLADQKKAGSMRCYRGRLNGRDECMNVSIDNQGARDAVLKAIQQKIRTYIDEEECRRPFEEGRSPAEMIASVINAISAEKKAWMKKYDDYSDGKLEKQEFLEYKKRYNKKVEELEGQLDKLKRAREAQEGNVDFSEYKEVLKSEELTQEVLDAFVECIEVFEDNRMDIHWKFVTE